MTADDMERAWRREDADRLGLAAGCLVAIEHAVSDLGTWDRDERLAEAAHELRIALRGDDVARAELHAYNDDRIRRVLARHQEWIEQDQAERGAL